MHKVNIEVEPLKYIHSYLFVRCTQKRINKNLTAQMLKGWPEDHQTGYNEYYFYSYGSYIDKLRLWL